MSSEGESISGVFARAYSHMKRKLCKTLCGPLKNEEYYFRILFQSIAANGGSISYSTTWSFTQDSTQSCENVFHNIVHTGKFKQVVRFYNIDTLLSISKRLLRTKSIL